MSGDNSNNFYFVTENERSLSNPRALLLLLLKTPNCLNRVYDDIDAVSASSPLQTSVRDAIVESQQVLSKEDFLKLMLPDSLSMEEGRRKVSYFLRLCVSQTQLP